MSPPPATANPHLPARVTLEISLRPALPIEDVEKLARRAEAEGVTVETLIIRGIGAFLESESQPVAA